MKLREYHHQLKKQILIVTPLDKYGSIGAFLRYKIN